MQVLIATNKLSQIYNQFVYDIEDFTMSFMIKGAH
jgi:hypothetical protein